MSSTKTHIIPCHKSLPQYLVERLAISAGRDFSKIAFILPTQRLQHYIRMELGKRFSACTPPHLLTIASFVRMLPFSSQHRIISQTEQKIIINALLHEGDFHYLRSGMENDLARFFNELADQNLGVAAFSRIKVLLQNDAYRDEVHLTRLIEQTEELEHFYQSYLSFLIRHKLSDTSRDVQQRCRFAAASKTFSDVIHFKKIWLAGFSDATAAQLLLFKKLLQDGRCEFFFHIDEIAYRAALQNQKSLSPHRLLADFVASLGLEPKSGNADVPPNTYLVRKAFGLDANEQLLAQNTVTIHTAASPLIELKSAVALIHRVIQSGQARPEEIVLVIPDEARYSRLSRSVFEQAQIRISDSLGLPLVRTQVGQWLHLILDILLHNWRAADLLSLLGNPITHRWLASCHLNIEISNLQEAARNFVEHFSIASNFMAYIRKASQNDNPSDNVANQKHLIAFCLQLETVLQNLAGKNTRLLGEWADVLWQLVDDIALEKLVLENRDRSIEQELATLKGLYAGLQSFRQLKSILTLKYKFREFYHLVEQNIFAAQIRQIGEPFASVQVMGVLEARSIPAKILIILGNTEGSFPTSLHRELFVAEPFRNNLGLTTFKRFEQLQDQHFYSLVAGFPEVHLFYSRQDEDRPAVKSRYIQRLELLNHLHPGVLRIIEEEGLFFPGDFLSEQVVHKTPKSLQKTFYTLKNQCQNRHDVRGDFQGKRQPIFASMSASTMEYLIFCPYRYLLHKLNFSGLELPDEEMDNREAGLWLHRVCEKFFTGLEVSKTQLKDLHAPWHETITEENFDRALSRMQRLSRELMDKHRPRLDYLYQMHYIGWHKFLEREMARTTVSYPQSHYEFSMQNLNDNALNSSLLDIEITGRIDRVAKSDNGVRVIDYKTKKVWPSKKEIERGKVPQLPLYVEMLRKQKNLQKTANWSSEYFALWDGQQVDITDDLAKMDISESWRHLIENLESRLVALYQKQIPMQPEEDKDKCRFCDYDGICRRQENWG